MGSYVVLIFDGGTGAKGELPVSAEPTALPTSTEKPAGSRSGVVRAPAVRRGSEYGFECREFNLDYVALEELVAGTQPMGAPGESAARSPNSPTLSYWTMPPTLLAKLKGTPLIQR